MDAKDLIGSGPEHKASNKKGLGIACALGAWFIFSLNDVGIKYLSGDYALHEIVLIRSVVGLLITLAIIVPLEGGYQILKTQRLGLQLLRGLCIVVANIAFFAGLATLSLPVATAIFFSAPFFITLLSMAFLGEKVGPYRWAAIVVGFAGVIIMMKPGTDSFALAAFLPLLAALAYALMQILTRKIGITEKASSLSFYIQIVFLVSSLLHGLVHGNGRFGNTGNPSWDFIFRAWSIPESRDLAIMVGLGVIGALGGYLVSQAYRICEATVIAPFEYAALLLAIFWSVLIWGIWPDASSWLGIFMIMLAGMLVFWREVVQDSKVAIDRTMPGNH